MLCVTSLCHCERLVFSIELYCQLPYSLCTSIPCNKHALKFCQFHNFSLTWACCRQHSLADMLPLLLCVLQLASLKFARAAALQQGPCLARVVGSGLEELNALYECPSASTLQIIPYLWKPIDVRIQCPTSWYSVYIADDEEELKGKIQRKEKTFCGLDLFWDATQCSIRASPFKRTLVGIRGARGCTLASKEPINLFMLASGIAGLTLFYSATFLSSSFVFRMSCGTAFITATSLALLMVVLFRLLPHKKTMAVVFTAAGSTGMAFMRWVTGHWLPSWNQLITHPLFGVYVLVSMVLGAIITYLYDDAKNPKVNTVIKIVLRLIGLVFVYFATWTSWPVSATVMGIMVAGALGPGVARGVHQTSAAVQEAAQVTHKFLTTPFKSRHRLSAPSSPYSALTPLTHTITQPINTNTVPLLPPTTLPPPSPSIFDEPQEDLSVMPRDYSGHKAYHPKATPPAPWEVQRKRQVKTFEEQMVATLVQRASAPQPQRVTRSHTSAQGVGVRSGSWGAVEVEEAGSQDTGLSSVVKQGYILNPNTGRLIKIGGDLYNQLLGAGYTPDTAAGTLVAPENVGMTAPLSGRSAGRSRTSARHR